MAVPAFVLWVLAAFFAAVGVFIAAAVWILAIRVLWRALRETAYLRAVWAEAVVSVAVRSQRKVPWYFR